MLHSISAAFLTIIIMQVSWLIVVHCMEPQFLHEAFVSFEPLVTIQLRKAAHLLTSLQ